MVDCFYVKLVQNDSIDSKMINAIHQTIIIEFIVDNHYAIKITLLKIV